MHELTTIKNGQTLDSREVSELVEKNHKELLRDIRTYTEYLAQRNFALSDFFLESQYKDSTGRSLPCYLVTRKGCELIANKMTGQKGVQFTAAYIERFHEMERGVAFSIPQTLPEALRLAADLAEQTHAMAAQIEQDRPKVIFANAVDVSDGACLVGELAKILKGNGVDIGQNRLFEKLRQDGYLIKRKGTDYNMPTQRSMEMSLFKIKETAVTHADGHVTINRTPKVTGKGQQYFINMFLAPSSRAQQGGY